MWNNLFGNRLLKREDTWEDFFAVQYTSTGKPDKVEPIIVEHLKNADHVVYGARAINAQIPPEYERPTDDWDIKTLNPRHFARKLEAAFEELTVNDTFTVEKLPVRGEDFNVFRIIDKRTGRNLVDASIPKKSSLPEYEIIDEIKYKALEAIEEEKIENLRNPNKRHRKYKDLNDLKRIRAAKREAVSTKKPFSEKKDWRPWRVLGDIFK